MKKADKERMTNGITKELYRWKQLTNRTNKDLEILKTEQALNTVTNSEVIKDRYLWIEHPGYLAAITSIRLTIQNFNSNCFAAHYRYIKPKVDLRSFQEDIIEQFCEEHSFIKVRALKRYIKNIKKISGKELWELKGPPFGDYNNDLFTGLKTTEGATANTNTRRAITKNIINKHWSLVTDTLWEHFLIQSKTRIPNCTSPYSNINHLLYCFITKRLELSLGTEILETITTNISYFDVYKDIVLLVPPAKEDKLFSDEKHSKKGPVIKFNNLSVYALQNYVVPKHVVTNPKQQTLLEIMGENNVEKRRVRIERYGWENLFRDYPSKVINKTVNPDNSVEILIEIEVDRGPDVYYQRVVRQRVLCTTCPSTGRMYFLPVAKEVYSCAEAQRYLRGDDYILATVPEDFTNAYPKVRA